MTDERQPSGASWSRVELGLPMGPVSMWQAGHLNVVSSRVGDQFHLTVVVTGGTRRPSAVEMLLVRRAFGMLEACEDVSAPGASVRHLILGPAPLAAEQRH